MSAIKNKILVILAVLAIGLPIAASAEEVEKSDIWLPSLQTETPQEGFELAIKLSRMGVKSTQSDKEVLFRERAK